MARAIQTDDPAILKRRQQTSARVQRHRDKKAKQEAFGEALEELAALEPVSKPSRARSKQALLKRVLAAEGVTASRLVKKKVQMLEATKLRQVGNEVREVEDFATQARSCEALTRDLQACGEYPMTDKTDATGSQPIIVTILSFSASGESVSRPALPLVLAPDDVKTLTATPVAKDRDHAGSARAEALKVSRTQYELPQEKD